MDTKSKFGTSCRRIPCGRRPLGLATETEGHTDPWEHDPDPDNPYILLPRMSGNRFLRTYDAKQAPRGVTPAWGLADAELQLPDTAKDTSNTMKEDLK